MRVTNGFVPGQRESSFAMNLDEFADEVMSILRDQPDVTEVRVERLAFLRRAEAEGRYAETVRQLNAADPH